MRRIDWAKMMRALSRPVKSAEFATASLLLACTQPPPPQDAPTPTSDISPIPDTPSPTEAPSPAPADAPSSASADATASADAPSPPSPACPDPPTRTPLTLRPAQSWTHPTTRLTTPAHIATGAESAQWNDHHIRIEGSLVIPAGISLALTNCTLEIVGPKARDHQIYLEPTASLTFTQSTIGGTALGGVNGTSIVQTAVDVRPNARLQLNNVCIQYNYGILVAGTLDATALTGGINPDSVIVSESANVTLRRSEFDLSFIAATEAGNYSLTLPVGTAQSTQYGRAGQLVPGATWLLELQEHIVPRYWFWFQSIGPNAPATRTTIRGRTTIIPSLLLSAMNATVNLRSSWSTHGPQQVGDFACGSDALMSGSIMDVGNVTLSVDTPSSVGAFGLYLNTGASIVARGPSFFSEVILRGASSLWVEGTPNTLDTALSAVALEVHERSTLTARAAVLGYRWAPLGLQGELIVDEQSQVRLDRVRWANLQAAISNNARMIASDSAPLARFDRACGPSSVQGISAPLRVIADANHIAPVLLRSALGSVVNSATRSDGVTAGARFVVGARNVRIRRIGRRLPAGVMTGVVVLRNTMGVELARTTVSSADLWNSDGIAYAELAMPVDLPAETSFDLFAETPVGTAFFDFAPAMLSEDFASVRSAFIAADRTVSVGSAGQVFGAVNVQVDSM